MTLTEGQWQIGDVVFGPQTMIPIQSMEQISYEVSPGDRPLPMSDQIRFTKDYIQPGNIQFNMSVLDNYVLDDVPVYETVSLPESGAPLMEKLKREWRADEVRKTWGEVKPLRYCALGNQRVLYGRPRNFATSRVKKRPGWLPVTAMYQLADQYSYSEEIFFGVTAVTPSGVVGSAIERGDGGGPTWLQAIVTGPIASGFVVNIGPHEFTVNQALASGEVIELNSKPWSRRAILASSSTTINVGTRLVGDSPYLEDLVFPAEEEMSISIHGSGTSGSTALLVQWQEAYHAI